MKKILVTLLMMIVSIVSIAQTNGDKLFMEGQKLQQTQTVSSQNLAIKKFQSAKVVYTTVEKKQMCDNQIAICNSNIESLKSGGRRKNSSQKVDSKSTLSLSHDKIDFDGDKSGSVFVNVNAKTSDWKFNLAEGIEGESSFVEVVRGNDNNGIEVSVKPNNTTISRVQTINVSHESESQSIKVTQQGKSVKLSTSSNLIEFNVKGGNKSLEIYTNSDSILGSNNNLAWWVESKPEWVEVTVDVKKNKGLVGKGVNIIKGLVDGKVEAASEADMKESNLKIVAVPLIKSDKEYMTGRRGEIIFASQDKRYKVIVVQQSK